METPRLDDDAAVRPEPEAIAHTAAGARTAPPVARAVPRSPLPHRDSAGPA